MLLEPVERRIERAGLDLEQLTRAAANRLADAIAVLRPPLERLENQQVERPLQQLDAVLIAVFLRHRR